jgi:hypothetical protein
VGGEEAKTERQIDRRTLLNSARSDKIKNELKACESPESNPTGVKKSTFFAAKQGLGAHFFNDYRALNRKSGSVSPEGTPRTMRTRDVRLARPSDELQ